MDGSTLMLEVSKSRIKDICQSLIRAVVVFLSITFGLPHQSFAQTDSPVSQLDRWLAQLQANGAVVKIGSVEILPDGLSVQARDLTIGSPAQSGQPAPVEVWFGALTLSGIGENAREYHAGRIQIKDLKVVFGGTRVNAGEIEIANATLPRFSKVALDVQHPTASIVTFTRTLFLTHATSVILNGISWGMSGAKEELKETIQQLTANNIDAGTISALDLRDINLHWNQLSETRVGELSIQKMSLAILLDVVDPQSYRVGATDRPWRQIIEQATLVSLDVHALGSHTLLREVNLGSLEARRFTFDPTQTLDLAATDPVKLKAQPTLSMQFANGFAESVRIGNATLRDLAIDDAVDPPGRRTTMGAIEVIDLAPKTAKSLNINSLQVQSGDAGVRIGKLGAADVDLVTGISLADGSPAPTIPEFSSLTLDQIVLVKPGVNALLGTVTVAAEDYVGRVPTHLTASIAGVTIPVANLPNNALRANLAALKLDNLKFDANISAAWQEAASELDLSSAQISVEGFGKLSATASLVGIPRTVFEDLNELSELSATAGLKQARIRFEDSGLISRVLTKFAEVNKVPVEKIRSAITSNVPTLFGAITDAAPRNRLIFAAISFLNNPKTVNVFTNLEAPLSLDKLLEAWRKLPQTLPGLLKLDAVANRPL